MRRFFAFVSIIAFAQCIFAYYGDYTSYGRDTYSSGNYESHHVDYASSMPNWLVFVGIVMIVGAILEIILFFKIWGMTNDVRSIKKEYTVGDTNYIDDWFLSDLRKNLILGNIDSVKKTILMSFVNNVERSYSRSLQCNYSAELRQKSIRIYVDKLQEQLNKIGEDVPDIIKNMETYDDYFNLFTESDFIIKKDQLPED